MARRMVSGTPGATVVDEPKLERMSERTTPLSASRSGPLEPSPGNGPAVSSGISSHASVPAANVDAGAGRCGAVVGDAVPGAAVEALGAQPMTDTRPAPTAP